MTLSTYVLVQKSTKFQDISTALIFRLNLRSLGCALTFDLECQAKTHVETGEGRNDEMVYFLALNWQYGYKTTIKIMKLHTRSILHALQV